VRLVLRGNKFEVVVQYAWQHKASIRNSLQQLHKGNALRFLGERHCNLFKTNVLVFTFCFCKVGETGKINGYQRMTGSDEDIEYVLQMRQNQVHYIHLMLDIFAPCIVSTSTWNNNVIMEQDCGTNQ
jgi:hypothetical protein